MAKTGTNKQALNSLPTKGKRMSEDRAKLIASHFVAGNCSNKMETLLACGYAANTAKYCAAKIFNNALVKQAIEQQIRPIVLRSEITLESLQSKLDSIAEDILSEKDKTLRLKNYPTAISAINSLLKTIGGFQADGLPDSALAGKALDASKMAHIRRIADIVYSERYLVGSDALLPGTATSDVVEPIDSHYEPEEPTTEALEGEPDGIQG